MSTTHTDTARRMGKLMFDRFAAGLDTTDAALKAHGYSAEDIAAHGRAASVYASQLAIDAGYDEPWLPTGSTTRRAA